MVQTIMSDIEHFPISDVNDKVVIDVTAVSNKPIYLLSFKVSREYSETIQHILAQRVDLNCTRVLPDSPDSYTFNVIGLKKIDNSLKCLYETGIITKERQQAILAKFPKRGICCIL